MMTILMALFFANSSYCQCVNDCIGQQSINFATGTDANGGLLAAGVGAFDANWIVTNGPNNANLNLPNVPLAIPNYNNAWGRKAAPNILAQMTSSGNWISPFPSELYAPNNPNVPFEFTYEFCVCANDDYNFQGLFNADDAARLYVNNTLIANSTSGGNSWEDIIQFNATVALNAGKHKLRIELHNTNRTAMGVNCSGTITAQGIGAIATSTCCSPVGAINGRKYKDVNSNGVIDGQDVVVPNWDFQLTGPGGSFNSTTDAYGTFAFTNLVPGTYTLTEVLQAGSTPVFPAGGSTTVVVTAGNVTTVNFLNVIPPPDPRGCCDEIANGNLIPNGSFEAGNFGVTSGYTYEPSIGTGSVSESKYAVVTGTQASAISDCWGIVDHTTCTADGRFMVVNGATHNPNNTTVYQKSFFIEGPLEREYIFCMYYQHLPQCEFDIFDPDKIDVQFSGVSSSVEGGCDDNEDHCGWEKISYVITPTSPNITITVSLDESGAGDGNDVAFDDFSLRLKQDMPSDYCIFGIEAPAIGIGLYSISANPLNTSLPPGFNVTWTISEVTCPLGPSSTPIPGKTMTYTSTPNGTNFPGFCCSPGSQSPGVLEDGKCYKFTRQVENCCYETCEHPIWLRPGYPEMMLITTSNDSDENGYDYYQTSDGKQWTKVDAIDEISDKNKVKIYPNPGDGVVTIKSDRDMTGSTVVVYGSDGRKVLDKVLGPALDVNISNLASGVYSFEITEPDGTVTHKNYVKQ